MCVFDSVAPQHIPNLHEQWWIQSQETEFATGIPPHDIGRESQWLYLK